MRGTIALTALIAAGTLGGCISTGAETPEWFAQRSAESDSSYPSLRDVPRTSSANTDAAHWRAVEAEMLAAGQSVKDNPRSEPASAGENPDAFLEEAREDLEETRQSHEP